jgi:multidrug efflux system membrane fusion protein
VSQGATLPVTAMDRGRTTELASGRFLTLDNQIDPQTGTVKAKARFANDKGALFPNQFVNVRLLLDTVQSAVTVPVTAVRQGSNGDFVYVLREDHTVSLRNVKRGVATTDKVAITAGLQAGEKVITEGGDRLRDGARVVLPGERPASGAFGGRRGASGAAWAASGERPASGASGAWGGRRRRASDAGG